MQFSRSFHSISVHWWRLVFSGWYNWKRRARSEGYLRSDCKDLLWYFELRNQERFLHGEQFVASYLSTYFHLKEYIETLQWLRMGWNLAELCIFYPRSSSRIFADIQKPLFFLFFIFELELVSFYGNIWIFKIRP